MCGSLSLPPALLADDIAPAFSAEDAAPEDVPLVEFIYLDTLMPDESYHTGLRSLLLYLRYVFRALINSLAMLQIQCCFTSTKTTRTIRDGEPRTTTSTFTQLLSSEWPWSYGEAYTSSLSLASLRMC